VRRARLDGEITVHVGGRADPDGSVAGMADVTVRAAREADGDALARAQLAAWLEGCSPDLPPDVLDRLTAGHEERADTWRASATAPPSPRHRVLVACEGEVVVGGAALGPADDPDLDPVADAELLALYVRPESRQAGHGSRLLAAGVDHLRGDGFRRATAWVDERDAATRGLLTSAGWDADGSRRSLDLDGDGRVVRHQDRLQTDLEEEPS
jgi:GNAT superfamily N-acetyltransferase